MISTEQIIYCLNPDCTHPINPLGNRACANCQTPIVHRYLWACGPLAAKIPPGTKVANRYEVITQQIWLDTQPGISPEAPPELPQQVIPYLRLYQEQLHIPQPYGFTSFPEAGTDDILLLENGPIDQAGRLLPTLADSWVQASAVRQVYWLWQILQLWTPLSNLGVAKSLLISNNLRVRGWCLRLLELHPTPEIQQQPCLQHLGQFLQPWVASAKISIASELENIVQQMCSGEVDLETISEQLNVLLLSSAAELPLNLEVAGATDTGRELTQNEDTCYPNGSGNLDDPLIPHLSIVCDGIGGHEGGEVASQLAVQSLKLQIRALFAEVAEQFEIISPNLLTEQLEACLRVVNNMISARNDEQKRQGRERMATTLVMALQLPQKVQRSEKESANAHELYIANIGDSRAYWITRHYCQLLTVDDDVATREVRFARSLYRQALTRPDASALTQALGTKDAEALRLSVKRYILEEDGILLLCSDGLSDNNWVEQSWQDYAVTVLTGKQSVEEAVRNWINLANEKNGYDNTSVVMTHCNVSPEYLVSITHLQLPIEMVHTEIEAEFSYADTSPTMLDLDITAQPATSPAPKSNLGKRLSLVGLFLVLLIGGTGVGIFAWWQRHPQPLLQICRLLPQKVQRLCPPTK